MNNDQQFINQLYQALDPELAQLIHYILENNIKPNVLYLTAKQLIRVIEDTGYGDVKVEINNKNITFIDGHTRNKIGYKLIKETA